MRKTLPHSLLNLTASFLALSGGLAEAREALPTINLLETDRISIFAEKPGERSYAERFAETVYEAAYQTTGESAGRGLVIMGNYDDPHPILLIKKYLDVAETTPGHTEGPLFGAIMDGAIRKWEEGDRRLQEEIGMDIESVAYVIPMPLEPAILNLYLAAREEAFDDASIEERYRKIEPAELSLGDFEKYDWVIYLPPRNAIDRVIRDVLPHVMKKEKMGFFKRSLVKGAVFTFKPVIRDAMEGVRKSLLYEAILKATSDFSGDDIEALTQAYRDSLMPRGRVVSGSKHKRSVEAIRAQLEENEAYALDPFVPPTGSIKEDPEFAVRLEGKYADESGRSHRIFQEEGRLHWQKGDGEPVPLSRVSEALYTTDDRDLTVEFFAGSEGDYGDAELRRERWRMMISRKR